MDIKVNFDTTGLTEEEILEMIEERKHMPIGKYVSYRKDYLREVKPEYYAELIASGELINHLWDIRDQAEAMKKMLVEQQQKNSPEWKQMEESEEFDFMLKWRLLEQFGAVADEIIYKEIIYV